MSGIDDTGPAPDRSASLEELARAQRTRPVDDLSGLAGDFWESDEEVNAFLLDVRSSRNSSLT